MKIVVLTQVPNIRAKAVSCGDHNMMIIDINDKIWVCGDNEAGQLGLVDRDARNIQTEIPNLKAKQISCGSNYMAIIDPNVDIWIWGQFDGEVRIRNAGSYNYDPNKNDKFKGEANNMRNFDVRIRFRR